MIDQFNKDHSGFSGQSITGGDKESPREASTWKSAASECQDPIKSWKYCKKEDQNDRNGSEDRNGSWIDKASIASIVSMRSIFDDT